jgi:hypothetical protein
VRHLGQIAEKETTPHSTGRRQGFVFALGSTDELTCCIFAASDNLGTAVVIVPSGVK